VGDVRFRDAAERVSPPPIVAVLSSQIAATTLSSLMMVKTAVFGVPKVASLSGLIRGYVCRFVAFNIAVINDGYRKGFYLCFAIGEGEDGLAFQEWVVIGRQ
jgi:hypothetical protein